MPNTKDLNPADGTMLSVIGVPKSGKSHLAASATKYGKAFGFLALEELPSYAGLDVEYELLTDDEWRPSQGLFKAKAYKAGMAKLAELEKRDDIRVIVNDTMSSGWSEAIWNDVMMGYGTDDPRTLGGNSRQPYVTYASRMTELMTRLALLRARKKVHVLCTWHEDIREYEGSGAPRKETEGSVTRVKWDLARLPMMKGGLRQDIAKWFDFSFYVEAVNGSKPHRSKLVVVPPDGTRQLAGVRLDVVKELQALQEVPNDFVKLMEIVVKRYGKVAA